MNLETKVYEILTKKKYNRDLPFLEDRLKQNLQSCFKQHKPIKLIGFWGVGPKSHPNWADLASCEFLLKIRAEVKEVYTPSLEFVFVFSNLHGLHNGISEEWINNYAKEIEKLFESFGFKFMYLHPLWQKYGISFEKIDEIFNQKDKNWWDKIDNSELIENSAQKRNNRADSKTAAQRYYIMRVLEKEMLEKEFDDSIFHAFQDSRFRNILPHLPTLYLYSIKKGSSTPPWFITENR